MPDPSESTNSSEGTREEEFLFAEYKALIDIDGSRNDRLDRFLTIFTTLAAAPWALYALVLKEGSGFASLFAIPSPVAAAFVMIGILGALVAMMFIQMRFTIILYTRALNAIRGYFITTHTPLTFRLPSDPTRPRYYERGTYIQFAVIGMSLVNSGYIALGLYNLIVWPGCVAARPFICTLAGIISFCGHMGYYRYQAQKRERNSSGAKELHWGK